MNVKKAELHVHLEGSISPALAAKLAKRNHIPFPKERVSPDGASYLSNGFLDFISVYDDVVAAVIKTPEDYYEVAFEYLKSIAIEGAIYTEMLYAPDLVARTSKIPSIEHLTAIQQAIDDAKAQYDIVGRIHITAVRHFGAETAEHLARQLHKNILPCVTGFNLGGDEKNYPPKLFIKAYEIAAAAGLSCSVHAGEFDDATRMVEAIEHLPIKRIGHGVNAIYSKDTIELLKEKNIALELCPTSNIFLGLFKDIHHHPFPKLYEAGINISINSDDPPLMKTNLAREYEIVQQAYHYSDATMNAITTMAIHAAFVDEVTRKELLAKIPQPS